MAGGCISREKLSLDGRGLFFSRKSLVLMAGAHVLSRKSLSGCLGPVFLEEKLGLDAWGAYREIHKISAEFSFMVLEYNSYVKVASLCNLCGGTLSGPPSVQISRENV